MREAFDREVLEAGAMEAAPALLGAILLRVSPDDRVVRAGIVVETEAYTEDDPASHCFRGETRRNGAMFGRAGLAYIHINYGIHRCLNVVTGPEGHGQGVLLRALWPIAGIEAMRQTRTWPEPKPVKGLTDGPGKLTQALAFGMELDRTDLLDPASPLRLLKGHRAPLEDIQVTPRIGIKKAAEWPRRFLVTPAAYPRIAQVDF
ncbi:MAG: DNA-3-methyladenine glycosylase [Sumerlaeia bacterium]